MRTGVDVKLIGKVSAITDNGSPVLLGSRGRFKGVPFEVVGRLQVTYARGTWNEWFLNFSDATVGWLADAQGQFSIVRPRAPATVAGRVPPFNALALNAVLTIDNIPVVVVDRRGASYKGAEGILPFEAEPGMTFYGADLRGFAGEFMSLDYGNNPDHNSPLAYLGQSTDLLGMGLHPLRTFKGWPRPSRNPAANAQPGS